jgi:hypothetical protein
MNLALQFIYLIISSSVSYCIFINKYLYLCVYTVCCFCILDYILHVLKINKLKRDMILHHNFVLCNILFIHNHLYPVTYNINDANIIIRNVLSTEISTIFLILNNLIKHDKLKIINNINQVFFVSSFIYYRIYNYWIYIIISKETNLFIINVSKNNFHLIYMYIGIYGLFAINIFWLTRIFNKIYNLITN